MNDAASDNSPPRAALLGIVGLIVATLLLVAVTRMSGIALTSVQPESVAAAHVTTEASLHFADRGDGAVTIHTAADDRLVIVLAPGTNGFVRGVMRGLARDRRMRGLGASPPFLLTRWSDGRLTLRDSATGRTIDLGAFGSTNTAAFAAILAAVPNARN